MQKNLNSKLHYVDKVKVLLTFHQEHRFPVCSSILDLSPGLADRSEYYLLWVVIFS